VEDIKHCLCNTTAAIRREAFPIMRRAIDRAQARAGKTAVGGQNVVYECANYPDQPWKIGRTPFEGCNVWRVSEDVPDSFKGWTAVVDKAVVDRVNQKAGPAGAGGHNNEWGGGWSSFDYLQVRNGGGQTLDEYRAQVSLWAVLGAPLFIGADVRTMSEEVLAIYKNAEVIAVSQDRAGAVGSRIFQDSAAQIEVWVRPLAPLATCAQGSGPQQGVDGGGGGDRGADQVLKCQARAALVLLNRSMRAQKMQVTIRELTQSSGLERWGSVFRDRMVAHMAVRDVWKHLELGVVPTDGTGNLSGKLEMEVGPCSAFLGVVTLCVADAIVQSLSSEQVQHHVVWGA